MPQVSRARAAALLAALAVALLAHPAIAQTAQSGKIIRVISPYPPGGSSDYMARLMATMLRESLGQPVIVENRAGAGGMTGSDVVAKAAPDGQTYLFGSIATHAIAPHLYRRVPYDALRDFTPITIVARIPTILVVHPSVPMRSVKDLVQLAKSHPGKLNFGSSGAGSMAHLTTGLLMHATGIQMTHVPYKGASQSLVELIGGQIDLMFGTPPSAISLVRSGRLRAVAVSSAKRSSALPAVPTIAESGVPGFEVAPWWVLYAPAGLPQDMVTRVNGIIVEGLRLPQTLESLKNEGVEPVGSTPEETAAYGRAEWGKWAKAVAATGIKLD